MYRHVLFIIDLCTQLTHTIMIVCVSCVHRVGVVCQFCTVHIIDRSFSYKIISVSFGFIVSVLYICITDI